MSTLQGCLFVAWALVGTLVVAVRDPLRQIVLVGIMGLLAALTFFSVSAADVALSMIVVGAIALPAMLLLAAARVDVQDRQDDDR